MWASQRAWGIKRVCGEEGEKKSCYIFVGERGGRAEEEEVKVI